MKIDRERVKKAFADYTAAYDITDDKIRLKVEHTDFVADHSEEIAKSLELASEDIDLAWLIGMLHDTGRFEQLRRFNTFNDRESINHAEFGADLLFGDDKLIFKFIDEPVSDDERTDFQIIEDAIRYHNRYRYPKNLDERTLLFTKIIRDADKIDIIRVQTAFPLEVIYNVSSDDLYNCEITPEVLNAMQEHHAVLRSLKKTPVDHVIGHLSLLFELEFDISLLIVARDGHVKKLLSFESNNPKTQEQMCIVRKEINTLLSVDSKF